MHVVQKNSLVVGFVVAFAALVVQACSDSTVLVPIADDAGASDACTQCGVECVDTTTDPRHCGGCGTTCATGAACVAGMCKSSCPTGQVSCGGTCIDPTSNPQHCGASGACDMATGGAVCAPGQVCNAGACATVCAANLVNCGGACVDPATNNKFCGATGACGGDAGGSAGAACGAGKVCAAGVCAESCPPSQPTACPAAAPTYCANTMTDTSNCGACGTQCNAGQQCGATGCACPAATPDACGTGASAFCTSFAKDPANCGACGTQCGAGQECGATGCACPATTPDACGTGASALCRSFLTDPANCGSCGNTCASGEVCNAGTCAIVCSAGQTTCGPTTAPYCSALTDVNNCGSCGNACAVNKDCSGGAGIGACVTCTPKVAMVPVANAPPPPAGLKVTCLANGFTGPCPVVTCGQVTYWEFSYLDNRTSYGVVGYGPQNVIFKGPVELMGDRYINTISVNGANQTVSLTGQSATLVEPWALFQ